MRGDIIQWFKIEKSLENLNWISPPGVVEGRCGRRPQLSGEIVKGSEQRWNLLTNRIINAWNRLSDEAVESGNLNVFKNRIDKIL